MEGTMSEVKLGDIVRVNYVGRLEDGTVVDSSQGSGPLVFETGRRMVIAGMERLIIGMKPGERKAETVPAEQAFGLYRRELTSRVSRSWFTKQQVTPEIGLGLKIKKSEGQVLHAVVTDVAEDTVTLDANHRLAGKDLVLDVELLENLGPAEQGDGSPAP
jgi:FKBP-type peptidyl-prolyl cis-trans isomerase 2